MAKQHITYQYNQSYFFRTRSLNKCFLSKSFYLVDVEIEYINFKYNLKDYKVLHISYNQDLSKKLVLYLPLLNDYKIIHIPKLQANKSLKENKIIKLAIDWKKPNGDIIKKHYSRLYDKSNLKIGYINKYGWKLLKVYNDEVITGYSDYIESYSLIY